MKWLSVIMRRKRFCTDLTSSSIGALVRVGPEPTTLLILSVFTFFFFFSQNSAMGKLPSLQPLRGPCGRPAAWFVRKAIYECDPVCARSESVYSHAFHFSCVSLSHLYTFSRVHWLTFVFLTFPFVHLFTFSLAHFLTFLISEFSANRWELVVNRLRNAENTKASIVEWSQKHLRPFVDKFQKMLGRPSQRKCRTVA